MTGREALAEIASGQVTIERLDLIMKELGWTEKPSPRATFWVPPDLPELRPVRIRDGGNEWATHMELESARFSIEAWVRCTDAFGETS